MLENLDIMCGGNGHSTNFASPPMSGACGGLFQVRSSSVESSMSDASGQSTTMDSVQSSFYTSDDESFREGEDAATIMSEGSAPDQQAVSPMVRMTRDNAFGDVSVPIVGRGRFGGTPYNPHGSGYLPHQPLPSIQNPTSNTHPPQLPGQPQPATNNPPPNEWLGERGTTKQRLTSHTSTETVQTRHSVGIHPSIREGSPIPQVLVSSSNIDAKQQVADILSKHEPSRLPLINKLMKKFEGKEQELLDRLNQRYSASQVIKVKSEQPIPVTKVIASAVITDTSPSHSRTPSTVAAATARELLAVKPTGKVRDLADLSPPPVTRPSPPVSRPGTPNVQPQTSASSTPQSAAVPVGEQLTGEVDVASKMAKGSKKAERDKKRLEKKDKKVHAKVSKLVTFVYGQVSATEHKARLTTILRAYSGRELVLLKLLETKAEVKIDSDKSSPVASVPKTISYVSDVDDDVGSVASAKSNKSNKSTRSNKSNRSNKSGGGDRGRSRSGSVKSIARSRSSSGRNGPPRAGASPRPRKGITKSSNGDDDTISTLSHGTAQFARRQAQAAALSNSSSSGSGKIDTSSAKENTTKPNKVKTRSSSWFGRSSKSRSPTKVRPNYSGTVAKLSAIPLTRHAPFSPPHRYPPSRIRGSAGELGGGRGGRGFSASRHHLLLPTGFSGHSTGRPRKFDLCRGVVVVGGLRRRRENENICQKNNNNIWIANSPPTLSPFEYQHNPIAGCHTDNPTLCSH